MSTPEIAEGTLEKRQSQSIRETGVLLLKALRPKQWPKNLIVYAPLLFAVKLHIGSLFVAATVAVVAFCLISSGLYLLNDVFDAEADRAHPVKCQRPIASGRLGARLALAVSLAVIVVGLFLSYL